MKKTLLAAIVIVCLSLLPVSAALAQPLPPGDTSGNPLTVGTSAQISPQGQPPLVEWKWELPDMDPNTPGVQYLAPYDDDPAVAPVLLGTPQGVHHMMQVAPYPEDLPAPRLIAYWMAVEDPNGIADIGVPFFIVYHPDGSFKYKLHASRVACSEIGTVDGAGAPVSRGIVLQAAIATGQMTTSEADVMIERCYKNEKGIYMAAGEISKEQPAGEYRVEATAVDAAGNTNTMTNWFDVLSIVALRIDFTTLNFGTILPNTPYWLSGDRVFAPPSDTRPTVKNVGNDPMFVHIAFTRMEGANFHNFVEVFDGRLGTTVIPEFPGTVPGQPLNWQCFAGHSLGANVVGQLDLSIHPGFLPGDAYSGQFFIVGKHSCP